MGYSVYAILPKKHAKEIADTMVNNFVPAVCLSANITFARNWERNENISYNADAHADDEVLGYNYSCLNDPERTYFLSTLALLALKYGPTREAGSFGTVPVFCYDGCEYYYVIQLSKYLPKFGSIEAVYKKLKDEDIDYFVVEDNGTQVKNPFSRPLLLKLFDLSKKHRKKISQELTKLSTTLEATVPTIPISERLKAPDLFPEEPDAKI